MTKITSKDVLGRDVVTKVEDKRQHNPEEDLEIFCEICVDELTEENFNFTRGVRR